MSSAKITDCWFLMTHARWRVSFWVSPDCASDHSAGCWECKLDDSASAPLWADAGRLNDRGEPYHPQLIRYMLSAVSRLVHQLGGAR